VTAVVDARDDEVAGGLDLEPTRCAICGTTGDAVEVYAANLPSTSYTAERFAPHRRPDRVHNRIVRCIHCGLVRSDPFARRQLLEPLYAESALGYDRLEPWRRTYGRYLRGLEQLGVVKGNLLEVGCGSGFFLEEALAQGYQSVRGVEPSAGAVQHARPSVRDQITVDVMRPGLFPGETFDVVCMFQVLDHLSEPGDVLRECLCVLRPGGLLLCLNHDVEALSARLLGERSPIVDVQHAYLYSQPTLRLLFERSGFVVRKAGRAFNNYEVDYLVRLAPLPHKPKRVLASLLRMTRLGRLRVRFPIGNQYLVAERPRA
jgi:SAM-dependent methyltransferase